ncbi:hypothetical protein BDV38DRAFT_261190 [Aspergillus pseudotamarii]|uniref:Uncharacterized protein n=1 Tax=Aspergillus pseudotamarii TaxID=132259 RepID=A0A5N6SCJ6_ASPPS|nr:uncharacterized protein BDV38DRAFT_261190 [Aspergillus pseudotamarii]KAE8132436.1 hypothetical protein BDV38DRAFT_261190 [Aspergillus pseudotamarii]
MARAYLALPDEEKNDVRRSQERYSKADRTAYDRILGWDNVLSAKWNPETRGSLPRAFGLIQFKNGSTNILSRTTLRKVLGARTADAEINRFYQELDITPPWATMPRFKAILGPERAPVESAHKNAAVLGSVGTSSSDDSWAVRRKYAVRSQYPDKEKRSVNTQQDRRSEDAIRTMIEQHQQQMKAMTDTITELLKRVNM